MYCYVSAAVVKLDCADLAAYRQVIFVVAFLFFCTVFGARGEMNVYLVECCGCGWQSFCIPASVCGNESQTVITCCLVDINTRGGTWS